MLSQILSRIAGPAAERERVERTIEGMHARAAAAPIHDRPAIWEKLARYCRSANERERALAYYGRAIDDWLYLGEYARAERGCREVIAFEPAVVRARCTLAFLALREGTRADFMDLVDDYVRAAEAAGQLRLTILRLQLMAGVTGDPALRRLLERKVRTLGARLDDLDLLESSRSREGRSLIPLTGDQAERWAFALRIAIAG